MSQTSFPLLDDARWQATRDAVHVYARVVGRIRRALAPRQKHWWHTSLLATASGLTTSPLRAGNTTFEVMLDLAAGKLVVVTSRGEHVEQTLLGQSAPAFCQETLAALGGLGIEVAVDRSLFADETPLVYEPSEAHRLWQALSQVDVVLKEFKAGLRRETSPVQLWPHHFDLAMLWFSGRLVPGQDPANEEWSDEQMNFGFSTGDAAIPEPYFYATAYPLPPGLSSLALPAGAVWHREGWQGALLPYEAIISSDDPHARLLGFLRSVQQAGASLM